MKLLSVARIFALSLVIAAWGCSDANSVQTRVVTNAPAPVDAGPYKIGRDDVLDVQVWKQPQLSGQVRVESDGTITMPLIGRIQAAGLSTNQLQSELTTHFGQFVHDPNVTVRVFNPASQVFYVLGEVTKPGMYQLMSGEVLSQALAAAGGPTEYASLGGVKIIRRAGDAQSEVKVNFSAVKNGDLAADVPLQRGDTIIVP